MPTILTECLEKGFGDAKAIDGLNLRIDAGERVALIGHNGSGKSTFMRCLLGLHNYKGKANIFGLDARQEREKILGRVAFVPQQPPALRLRVDEYLRFGQKLSGADPAVIEQYCARLGFDLAPHRKKLFLKLSGGMKHKLLIAFALSRKPDLLIMDEPTASLDSDSRSEFYNALLALPAHTTILLVSHRVDEIAGVVSRTIELDHGRVVFDDRIVASAYQERMSACPNS